VPDPRQTLALSGPAPARALAQALPFSGGPDVPDLPPAPLLERYVTDNPWPLAGALAALAIIAAIVFLRRGERRPALIALVAGVVLAGGVALASALVTTSRERVAGATRGLVAAVSRRDIPKVREILDPDARVYYFRARGGAGLDHIEQQIRTDFGSGVDVPSVRLAALQAVTDTPTTARSQVHVIADLRAGAEFGLESRPVRSVWRIYWRKAPDGAWRAEELELLWIGLPGIDNPSGR